MPKGKKCVDCNDGRMKRNYSRSYWKGIKFTDEHILGIEINKSKFNPQGWLCENCGSFIPDKDNYMMFLNLERKKEQQENSLNELKAEIDNLKNEFDEYRTEYIYTEMDIEIKKRYMLNRFWNLRGAIGTYNYLKGLKEGNKQSKVFYKEKMKRMELTDEQILKKAKLIQNKKNLGYT